MNIEPHMFFPCFWAKEKDPVMENLSRSTLVLAAAPACQDEEDSYDGLKSPPVIPPWSSAKEALTSLPFLMPLTFLPSFQKLLSCALS